ncbi:Glycosyltransferase involved in cell wall bisynthesis [Verrucomicrobium sp. GAS474]|uniref:glycosyltransferase family 2 protein n=1 Tax=Verrucomicrobium sp. GAS474 TaxID=1882831 RepID=UPI00087BEE2F|nr:glycosyltransferase family 2 protein [Verrucomicrobium sp. GAS474]SDT86079.1 Glycosyltransferase involved in cell wall bisynthesis [Verrucomicrobium sp. GAS474]
MISTVILTKNEAQDLPACLESLCWCDDCHVLDSGSDDLTRAIADAAGAQVALHPFEGFGRQRNHALDALPFAHPWVLFLDADERTTPEFVATMKQAVAGAGGETAGFYCCPKLLLDGQWLRFSDSFPKWQFRLLRRGRARFVNYGHGQKETEVTGKIGFIREPYLHYGFSKGWETWRARHRRYAAEEAAERLAGFSRGVVSWRDLFRGRSLRNKALKPLVSRIPGWPLLRFLHAYLFSGGFLDGKAGFTYCLALARYEGWIVREMHALRKERR